MRELKDYFCTYEQTQELIKLGLKDYKSLMVWNNENGVLKLGNSGVFTIARAPLRSQALDFFRELGYVLQIRANQHGHWYELEKDGITRTQGQWHTYSISENELISRLIELEKEARNGN